MSDLIQRLIFQLKALADTAEIDRFNAKLDQTGNKATTVGSKAKDAGKHAAEGLKPLDSALQNIASGRVGLESIKSLLGELATAAGPPGQALAALAAILAGATAGLKVLADRVADENEKLDNLAESLSVTKEELLTFRTALKLSGGDAETAAKGIQSLTEIIEKAKNGSIEARATLKRLGTDIEPGSIKTTGQALREIATAFKDIPATSQRASDLVAAFSNKAAKSIAGALESFEDVNKQIKEFGVLLSDQQQNDLRKYDAALDSIAVTMEGLGNQAGAAAAPAFTELAEAAQSTIVSLGLNSTEAQETIRGFLEIIVQVAEIGFKPFLIIGKAVLEQFNLFSNAVSFFDGSLEANQSTLGSFQLALGKIAETLNAILHPLETVQFLLDGNDHSVKKASDSTSKLSEEQKKAAATTTEMATRATLLTKALEEQNKALDENSRQISGQGKTATAELNDAVQSKLKGDRDALEAAKLLAEKRIATENLSADEIAKIRADLNTKTLELGKKQTELEAAAAKEKLQIDKEVNVQLVANAEKRIQSILEAILLADKAGNESLVDKLNDDLAKAQIDLEAAKTTALEQGTAQRSAIEAKTNAAKEAASKLEIDQIKRTQDARRAASEQEQKDTDLRNKKFAVDLETKKQQLLSQGLTGQQAEQELAFLKQQNLKEEIAGIDRLILSKSLETGKEGEILDLKMRRLALVGQIRDSEIAASGDIAAAKSREADAEKAKGDAETAARGAALSGIAALIASFMQGIDAAKKATTETIGEIVDEADKRFKGFVNAVYNAQTVGLFKYLADLASEAQQEAFKTRNRLFFEQKDREAADALKAQEDAQSEATSLYQSFLDDKLELDREAAEKEREIKSSLKKLPGELAAEELKSATKLAEQLEALDTSRAEKQARQLADETRTRIRAEQDAQAGILAAKNKAQQDALSGRLSILDEQVKAQTDLANAKTDEERAAAQAALDEISGRKKRQAEQDEKIKNAIASGATQAEVERLQGLFSANEDYLRRKREYEKSNNAEALKELESLQSEKIRLINEQATQEETAAETKRNREAEDRARAIAAEQAEYDRQRQALLDRNAEELTGIRQKYSDKEAELKQSLARERAEHDAALTALETRTQDAFSKMSEAAQAYFRQLRDGYASLPSGTPGAPGQGTAAPPPPSGSGPEAGPSNQPAPGASPPPPPSGGTQLGGGGGLKDKAEASAARAFIDSVLKLLARLQAEPGLAAGIVTDLKTIAGKTDEFLRSKGLSSKDKRDLVDIKQVLGFLISRTAQPVTAAGPAKTTDKPNETGQTQAGQTGGPSTTPTKAKNTDTTVPTGGQKQTAKKERDPAKAESLRNRADVVKSAKEAGEIFKEARQALNSGLIDPDDYNAIKARLDYNAQQGGFIQEFNTTKAEASGLGAGPSATNGPAPNPPRQPVAPTIPGIPSLPTTPPARPASPNGNVSPVTINGGIHGTQRSEIVDDFNKALDRAGIQ